MAKPRGASSPIRRKPPKTAVIRRKARAVSRNRSRRTYHTEGSGVVRTVPRKRFSRRRVVVGPAGRTKGRVLALAAAAGLITLLAFLFLDGRFYVNTVEVSGLTYASREEILQVARVQDYSVFWIHRGDVERRIEALPFVQSARVRLMLPNKVRIQVVERRPVALWQVNGQSFWVDGEGVALPVAGQLAGLPVLVDLDGSTVDEGGRIAMQVLQSVVELQRAMPDVGQFAFDRSRGLHFVTASGALVVLGRNQKLAQRVQELMAIQASLAAQGETASEINLSHEGGHYLKLTP